MGELRKKSFRREPILDKAIDIAAGVGDSESMNEARGKVLESLSGGGIGVGEASSDCVADLSLLVAGVEVVESEEVLAG